MPKIESSIKFKETKLKRNSVGSSWADNNVIMCHWVVAVSSKRMDPIFHKCILAIGSRIVTLILMFNLVSRLKLVNMGLGGYRVVSEISSSTIGLDERNVFVMHVCQLHMYSLCMLVSICLLYMYCYG